MNPEMNSFIWILTYDFTIFFVIMNSYLNSYYEFIQDFMILKSYATMQLHFMTYEFIYEFMFMKNIVRSYLKSRVPRFQMVIWTCQYASASAGHQDTKLVMTLKSATPWLRLGRDSEPARDQTCQLTLVPGPDPCSHWTWNVTLKFVDTPSRTLPPWAGQGPASSSYVTLTRPAGPERPPIGVPATPTVTHANLPYQEMARISCQDSDWTKQLPLSSSSLSA